MQSPYAARANIQCRRANAGFSAKKRKRLRKFFVEGLRGKRAILVPPQCSAINVRLRSLCDPNFHGLSATTTGEPCKHLLGGNRFSAIGLGDRKKQFGLLLSGQGEAAFVVFGQNSHRRALFECYTLDYDFTADNFSSGYLHSAKNTPIYYPSWTLLADPFSFVVAFLVLCVSGSRKTPPHCPVAQQPSFLRRRAAPMRHR